MSRLEQHKEAFLDSSFDNLKKETFKGYSSHI